MQTQTQEEITSYREHIASVPNAARFFLSLERGQYEEAVVEALVRAIPRLYALDYDDQVDVPPEIHAAILILERDLGLDFTEDE